MKWIPESVQTNLWAYQAGIFSEWNCPAIIVGGIDDHVHSLFSLSKNHALKTIVEEVKKGSSKWMKTSDGTGNQDFAWQGGYGAFSVSCSNVEVVKKYIETRGADGGPWRRLCALPAFWVGLMYDQTALDAAWDLVKDWTAEQREALRVAASVDGLQAKVAGINMHELAREAVAISQAGLQARARPGAGGLVPDETHFLNALHESIETGKVPADELLEHYYGDWNGDISRVFKEYSY